MKRPLGELVGHLEVEDNTPIAWTPIEAICLFQAFDEDGDPRWCMRVTGGVNDSTALGVLVQAVELVKRDCMAGWSDDP